MTGGGVSRFTLGKPKPRIERSNPRQPTPVVMGKAPAPLPREPEAYDSSASPASVKLAARALHG